MQIKVNQIARLTVPCRSLNKENHTTFQWKVFSKEKDNRKIVTPILSMHQTVHRCFINNSYFYCVRMKLFDRELKRRRSFLINELVSSTVRSIHCLHRIFPNLQRENDSVILSIQSVFFSNVFTLRIFPKGSRYNAQFQGFQLA